MNRRKSVDHVAEAAKARCDLNGFYAIIALCEGGLFSGNCNRATGDIVLRCKREAGKALRRYDRHCAIAAQGDS